MKYLVKIEDLIDNGLWAKYCELTGFSVHTVSEGMDDQAEVEISVDLANQLGL